MCYIAEISGTFHQEDIKCVGIFALARLRSGSVGGGQRIDNGRTNAGGISACCAKGPVHWREDKSNIPTLIDRNIK